MIFLWWMRSNFVIKECGDTMDSYSSYSPLFESLFTLSGIEFWNFTRLWNQETLTGGTRSRFDSRPLHRDKGNGVTEPPARCLQSSAKRWQRLAHVDLTTDPPWAFFTTKEIMKCCHLRLSDLLFGANIQTSTIEYPLNTYAKRALFLYGFSKELF